MRNQATLKSTILVVACALSCAIMFNSCAGETLYKIEKEQVDILNNLAISKGEINTGESAIQIKLDLSQDTILVEDFSELSMSEDFLFTDTQEATVRTSNDGLYKVEKVSYRDYSLEEYSSNRRKVTLNFRVDYTYDGEKRDTVLSPWYFQETPTEVKPSEPEAVKEVIPTFSMEINDKKNEATGFFSVNFKTGEKVDTTFKVASNLIKVGQVKGMDVYTTSTSYVMENMTCDTLSTTTTVVKDHFTVVIEKRVYSWVTNFDSSAGGKVSPKNEVTLTTIKSVTFEYEDYKYTWSFNASVVDVVRRIEEREEEGKVVEGQMRPYLGTYVLKVNTYLYSPQVPELDGTTPVFSSTAENHLYEVL